jgi:hypothetical protein
MGRRIALGRAALVLFGMFAVTDVAPGEEAHEPPASAAGIKAFVDPRTGELLPERPAGLPPEPTPSALDRSTAGLVEVPTAGGGSMIDLQGRFQTPLNATLAPDGTLRLRHAEH